MVSDEPFQELAVFLPLSAPLHLLLGLSQIESLILCPPEISQHPQHFRSGVLELKAHMPLRQLSGHPLIDPGFENLPAANSGKSQFPVKEKKVKVDLVGQRPVPKEPDPQSSLAQIHESERVISAGSQGVFRGPEPWVFSLLRPVHNSRICSLASGVWPLEPDTATLKTFSSPARHRKRKPEDRRS